MSLISQGHACAQFWLGLCHEDGFGVDEDMKLAAALYLKAAEQGHVQAQFHLGTRFSDLYFESLVDSCARRLVCGITRSYVCIFSSLACRLTWPCNSRHLLPLASGRAFLPRPRSLRLVPPERLGRSIQEREARTTVVRQGRHGRETARRCRHGRRDGCRRRCRCGRRGRACAANVAEGKGRGASRRRSGSRAHHLVLHPMLWAFQCSTVCWCLVS